MRLTAERAGIVTYAFEYHLAPEGKFPVQIEEIEYLVRWLFDNADEQGIDANKIAVAGDSAGGNMTCVIALKLRDENGPKLALHVPLFPEAAFPGDTPSGSENRTGLYLETNGISRWCGTTSRTPTTDATRTSPTERRIACQPAADDPRHERIRPTTRRGTRVRAKTCGRRERPDLRPQPRSHPWGSPSSHATPPPATRPRWNSLTSSKRASMRKEEGSRQSAPSCRRLRPGASDGGRREQGTPRNPAAPAGPSVLAPRCRSSRARPPAQDRPNPPSRLWDFPNTSP